jgi:hypothetical protein
MVVYVVEFNCTGVLDAKPLLLVTRVFLFIALDVHMPNR